MNPCMRQDGYFQPLFVFIMLFLVKLEENITFLGIRNETVD